MERIVSALLDFEAAHIAGRVVEEVSLGDSWTVASKVCKHSGVRLAALGEYLRDLAELNPIMSGGGGGDGGDGGEVMPEAMQIQAEGCDSKLMEVYTDHSVGGHEGHEGYAFDGYALFAVAKTDGGEQFDSVLLYLRLTRRTGVEGVQAARSLEPPPAAPLTAAPRPLGEPVLARLLALLIRLSRRKTARMIVYQPLLFWEVVSLLAEGEEGEEDGGEGADEEGEEGRRQRAEDEGGIPVRYYRQCAVSILKQELGVTS